jgi:hypothetical protein
MLTIGEYQFVEHSKQGGNLQKIVLCASVVASLICFSFAIFPTTSTSETRQILAAAQTTTVPAEWRITKGACNMEDKATAFRTSAWSWQGEWRPLLTAWTNKCYNKMRLHFDEKCMQRSLMGEPLRLSQSCAQCYVASSKCATLSCKMACLWSSNSDSCHTCVDTKCTPLAEECSGIPAAEPAV